MNQPAFPCFDECMGLIGQVAKALSHRNMLLASAESCTGGLFSGLCTELPGSSAWFAGGVVAYANQVKQDVLQVPASVIATHGAVSGPVVRRMALGALAVCSAQMAVAFSGVAGPDGGSPEKPVGTVWIGWACRPGRESLPVQTLLAGSMADGEAEMPDGVLVLAREYRFTGSRSEIRLAACRQGLLGCLALLEQE